MPSGKKNGRKKKQNKGRKKGKTKAKKNSKNTSITASTTTQVTLPVTVTDTASPCQIQRDLAVQDGYVLSSAPGCHVCSLKSSWIIEAGKINWRDFGLGGPEDANMLPDISVDPETFVLTVINTQRYPRCFYVTVFHPACDKDMQLLASGWMTQQDGTSRVCTTFIVLLPACSFMDICYLQDVAVSSSRGTPLVDLESDISDFNTPLHHIQTLPVSPQAVLAAAKTSGRIYRFPFATDCAPVLCSQGCHGHFTHFYPATRFAIDLESPVGLPVVAIAAGEVAQIQQSSKVRTS